VKIDGKFEICDELLKKGRQKFWRMKIKTFFWEKVKLGKFCMESEKNFGNRRGKSETEGKWIIASQGGWAPLVILYG